ncbi:MAG: TIM barrel protein [Prolixibacteraceae bacterium]|jgi:hydroxypyruvate isomerase|nr:TIM barrel protein [Prolixibacteraceae bacterium]
MQRRKFIQKSTAALAFTGLGTSLFAMPEFQDVKPSNKAFFKLRYAPSIGTFNELAGKDPIDQIRFCSDQGFRAMFDNGFMNKPVEDQAKIVAEINRLNLKMGPFVLYADFSKESMVLKDNEIRQMLVDKVKAGVEVCQRTGLKWALMVPGRYNEHMDWGYQTANVIDIMRELSEIALQGGMTIVLEPLNKRDHPGLFLTGMAQTYAICRGVNSPACKIVDDLYHQQITDGNLIPNIEASWSEIAAFHLGDNPGRKEPGTGEINFMNIFKYIQSKGYDDVLCMEHGRSIKGRDGELALIEAYRKVDNF